MEISNNNNKIFHELSNKDDDNKITNNNNETKVIQLGSPIVLSKSFITKLTILFIFYVVGVIFYHINEGWDVLDCIYYICVTISTIGYGYFHPTKRSSKIFTIFYILIGVSLIFTIISEISREIYTHFQEYIITQLIYRLYKRTEITNNEMNKFKILISLSIVALFIIIGGLFFSGNESWSFLEAVYWSVATITTVGYGDLAIKYESTRLFAIFYIIITTTIFAVAVNNILDVYYYTWTGHDTFTTNESENRIIAFKNAPNFVDDSIITKDKLILEILKQVNVESNEIISKITNTIELDGQLSYTKESINHYLNAYNSPDNTVLNPIQDNL